MPHRETHRSHRSSWLRAAVMGANDGLISTASLVVGVASAGSSSSATLLAATAGMVAGALSMAAGEYVSVSSQADAEKADLSLEESELASSPSREVAELTRIYQSRGLSRDLAARVARDLMGVDALDAHARDELGIYSQRRPRPTQAGLASAAAFTLGAVPPVILAGAFEGYALLYMVVGVTALSLIVLGGFAARLGGASVWRGSVRVLFWGLLAMALTALVGSMFGAAA